MIEILAVVEGYEDLGIPKIEGSTDHDKPIGTPTIMMADCMATTTLRADGSFVTVPVPINGRLLTPDETIVYGDLFWSEEFRYWHDASAIGSVCGNEAHGYYCRLLQAA